jgi:hypothetical protein
MLAAASFAVNPGVTLSSPGAFPATRVADDAFAVVPAGLFADFFADVIAACFTGFLTAAFARARVAVFAFSVFFAMVQVSRRGSRL